MTRFSSLGLMATLVLTAALMTPGCASAPSESEAEATTEAGAKSLLDELIAPPEELRRIGYAMSWSSDLGIDKPARARWFAYGGGRVLVVEEPNNLLTGIDGATGAIRWQNRVDSSFHRVFAPVIDLSTNRVYINSETRFFIYDLVEGQRRAVSDLEAVVEVPPVVVGPHAVFGSLTGRLFAHQIEAGHSWWRYDMPGGVVAPLTTSGASIIAADTGGNYLKITDPEGELVWRGRTFGPITARATLTTTSVYFPSEDQKLYAVSNETGRDRWSYFAGAPLRQSAVPVGSRVYLPLGEKGMVALDERTGLELWRIDLPCVPVAPREDGLLVTTGDRLLLLSQTTGEVLAQARMNLPVVEVMTGLDQELILATERGRLMRIDRRR